MISLGFFLSLIAFYSNFSQTNKNNYSSFSKVLFFFLTITALFGFFLQNNFAYISIMKYSHLVIGLLIITIPGKITSSENETRIRSISFLFHIICYLLLNSK